MHLSNSNDRKFDYLHLAQAIRAYAFGASRTTLRSLVTLFRAWTSTRLMTAHAKRRSSSSVKDGGSTHTARRAARIACLEHVAVKRIARTGSRSATPTGTSRAKRASWSSWALMFPYGGQTPIKIGNRL